MRYVVGDVSLAVGGAIFSPGEEVAAEDFPSEEAFRSAAGRGLVVAEGDGGEPAAESVGAAAAEKSAGKPRRKAAE